MKIVNRKEFLKLPENTVYTEYEPCVFGPLRIKMQTLPSNDWGEQALVDAIECSDGGDFIDQLELARLKGASLKMDFNCCGRNGCFGPENELFVVLESEDIKQLLERLRECLGA